MKRFQNILFVIDEQSAHEQALDRVSWLSKANGALVMGTLARTGITGLFIGNTAETILNHITCSVLTVKAKGFVSPVELEGATS